MRFRGLWLSTLVVVLAAAPASGQPARDSCLEAARALMRQQVRWEDDRGSRSSRDVLRWRAADGTWGSCGLDSLGRVYEVRVDRWSGGASATRPGEPGFTDLTEEYGFDRRGDDYTSITARTLGECQAACRTDARCHAYTFSGRDARCWLKTRANAQQANRDMVTGYKTGAGSGDTWPGMPTEEWGLDRRGNDYANFPTRGLAACKEACGRDARCRAYTFDTRNETCFLKDRVNAAQRNEGMVTGVKP
jgi:hypothetical protein